MPETEALAGLIARVIGKPIDAIRAIEPVPERTSGGQSFVVDVDGRRLHAKRIVDGSQRLLSLVDELALLRSLDSAGIAPVPVAANRAAGLLLTEQLVGFRALEPGDLRADAMLGALADVLLKLHQVPPSRCPVRFLDGDHYRRVAETGDPAADRGLRDELRGLADLLVDWPERPAVCHGDLIATNVLVPGDGPPALRLVDFEYAQLAPPVLDLASVSVMNDFDSGDDDRLLEACYDAPPFSRRDFAKVRRLVALTAHFWARVHPGHGVERYLLDEAGATGRSAPA